VAQPNQPNRSPPTTEQLEVFHVFPSHFGSGRAFLLASFLSCRFGFYFYRCFFVFASIFGVALVIHVPSHVIVSTVFFIRSPLFFSPFSLGFSLVFFAGCVAVSFSRVAIVFFTAFY